MFFLIGFELENWLYCIVFAQTITFNILT